MVQGNWRLSITSLGTLLHTALQKTVIFIGIPVTAEFGRGHGGALWHVPVVLAVIGGKIS